MLAHIWFGFFAAAFIAAIYQWLVNGHAAIFTEIMQSTFDMAALSVEVAIGLIGVHLAVDYLNIPVPEGASGSSSDYSPWIFGGGLSLGLSVPGM